MKKVCCNKKDCSFNGKPQPIENFYRQRNTADGLSTECVACKKVRQKKWNDNKNKNYNDFFKLLVG